MLLSVCLFASSALTSCHKGKLPVSDEVADSALQVVDAARVHRSENGRLQMELDAPVIRKYDIPIPKTLFAGDKDHRVHLRIYDDEQNVKVLIEANWAISYDDRNIMEAHDSVVVIDYRGGDTIYLQDLIWNSAEDRIYSDHPLRARNGNRITEGDGFSSNQQMDNIQITHQRGVIEFED